MDLRQALNVTEKALFLDSYTFLQYNDRVYIEKVMGLAHIPARGQHSLASIPMGKVAEGRKGGKAARVST